MSRALHPMLERLHRAAAAPAQLVQREQATRATFEVFAAALGRVGLQATDPWQRLLQLPLAEPGDGGGALQALLAQIEQGAAGDSAEEADALLPRSMSHGPQPTAQRRVPAPSRAQVPASTSAPAQGPSNITRAAVNQQATASAIAGVSGHATNTRRKGGAVPDSWLHRATRAGLLDALFTPVQRAGASPGASGAAPGSQALAGSPRAAALSASASAETVARQAGVAGLVQPVLPRLAAALERIGGAGAHETDGGAGGRRARRSPVAVAATTTAVAAALSRRVAAWGDGPGAPATPAAQDRDPFGRLGSALGAATGGALPPIWSASGQQANEPNEQHGVPRLQGLRGLAARAAMTNAASLRPLAGAPARPDEATMSPSQQAAAPDDEQLVEQLARVLKREAERDGIDVSDVLP